MSTRNHIVHFSSKSAKSNPLTEYRPLPGLIKNIQTICIDALEAKLLEMLNTADDRLFDMSENSNNLVQFDAMRLLRIKREGLIRCFKQELANNFKQTLGKIDSQEFDEENIETLSFENIALVKDDDLEEDIATDAMVNKARTKNQDALEHIRIRIDTLISEHSIESKNNPLEPVHICDAFRSATATLDLDIASLLVIYKLFDRSVVDELDDVYFKVNQFFIEKGILPELKSGPLAVKRKPKARGADAIDAMPVNETEEASYNAQAFDPVQSSSSQINPQNHSQNNLTQQYQHHQQNRVNQSTAQSSIQSNSSEEVLSVIQQLLAQQRGPVTGSTQPQVSAGYADPSSQIPMMDSIPLMDSEFNPEHNADNRQLSANIQPVDTNQLLNALSAIQFQQVRQAGTVISSQAAMPQENIRQSLSLQLPSIQHQASGIIPGALGQFNEDMIDIVSMLFDFILEDDNLQPELKSVIARLQIPMLKVGLVDKSFFSNRRHPARMLLNELAHAGLSWDKKDPTAKPMFEKISITADRIIQEFDDNVELFSELLTDFLEFKKQYLQRSTIFERRTKEAEEGKAKTETARSEVNKKLTAVCKDQIIPDVVKLLLKKVWSHAMLLERLKNNEEGWQRRVKVAKLLVWTVQSVDSAERLEKMTSRVPLLIKSLKEGVELISFSQIEASHLFEELEACHRQIIEVAREKINQPNEDEIIRLPAIDMENDFSFSQQNPNASMEASADAEEAESNQSRAEEIIIEEVIIEDIGFSQAETGVQSTPELIEPVHIDNETSQTIEQLRAGSWIELKIDGEFKRCKLAARIASTGKYIFVNRSGMKMAEFLTYELCQYLQLGNMKILDDEALFDRALESVISNLREMKAQA